MYLDDPSQEGFIKVSQAKNLSFLKNCDSKYVVLSENDSFIKTLFGIKNGKVFKVALPKESKILIINDVCIYTRNNLWYTTFLNDDVFDEILLGEKHELFLSCPSNIMYKTLYWYYFVKETDDYKELYLIADGKPVNVGKYVLIEDNHNDKIFAMRQNSFYNIFTPASFNPLEGKVNEAFKSLDKIFIWDNVYKHWKTYKGKLLGKNAAYHIENIGDKPEITLYRIVNGGLRFEKSSDDYEIYLHPFALIIDDMIYSFDEKTDLFDLDNPEPTLRKRIKDFFK